VVWSAGARLEQTGEAQLVEAAIAGDLRGFAALYERYYNAMVAIGYSVLGDIHLAEDAAQQGFAIACTDLPRLKSKERFGYWLAGICRNIARQMRRLQSRQTELDESMPAKEKTDGFDDTVRQAVWSLRAFYREPIVLRYYDNLPYERIATVLGISVQAVNGRIIRAKRKIKKYLERNGIKRGDYEDGK
jgi:RNA polymerase sigma-70 factor (ECF subfamily)